MAISIPNNFDVSIIGPIGPIGPVTIAGIPNPFHIAVDGPLPQIDLKLEPITLNPVTINPLTIDLKPIDLNIAIKEIPSIRAHLPANFSVGLSLLGLDLLCVRLCGEAQVITEPYRPNPCEVCGPVLKQAVPSNVLDQPLSHG